MLFDSLRQTFGRIKDDLNPSREEELLKQHRRSKATASGALQFLLVIILVPLMTQQITKQLVFMPVIDTMSGSGESAQVFLNAETREEVLHEIEAYEEELNFLILTDQVDPLSEESKEEVVQEKALEIFEEFQEKGKGAVGNVYSDLSAVAAFTITFLLSRRQFQAFKDFTNVLLENVSDTAKAFVLILLSDIVVGFHSPHGWDVLLESVSGHLGIVPSHSAISVFIATVPVVIDTFFKYWLFSSLSKMSPSTVATLKDMNE